MTNLISSYGKTNTKLKTRKRVKLFGDYGILKATVLIVLIVIANS